MTQVGPIFSELESYIDDSRKTIASGGDLQLAGLDDKIENLCNMVLSLSQDDRLLYEDRLQKLLGNLNALGLEMKEQVEGIKEIPRHQKATIAYKTADSRDNFGRRDKDENNG